MIPLPSLIPHIITSQGAVALCPKQFTLYPFHQKRPQDLLMTRLSGCLNLMPLIYEKTSHLSSASSSLDLADISEPLESDLSCTSCNPPDKFRCGLCERFLSQISPWSSRWIIRSVDMRVAAVLSCRHVFHAECLEQTAPKVPKSDPPCPNCFKFEEENSPDQQVFSKLMSSFPRLKHFREDVPSKQWGSLQAEDCVEGALHSPTCNNLVNRNRFRTNLSLKGNSGRELPGKLWKSGSYSTQLFAGSEDHRAAGSLKTTAGPV